MYFFPIFNTILEDTSSNHLHLPSIEPHNNSRTTDVALLHQNGVVPRGTHSPSQQMQNPVTSQSSSSNIHHSAASNHHHLPSSDLLTISSGSAASLRAAVGVPLLNRNSPPTGTSLSAIERNLHVTLDDRELWLRFQNLTNEMIVTKNGR